MYKESKQTYPSETHPALYVTRSSILPARRALSFPYAGNYSEGLRGPSTNLHDLGFESAEVNIQPQNLHQAPWMQRGRLH